MGSLMRNGGKVALPDEQRAVGVTTEINVTDWDSSIDPHLDDRGLEGLRTGFPAAAAAPASTSDTASGSRRRTVMAPRDDLHLEVAGLGGSLHPKSIPVVLEVVSLFFLLSIVQVRAWPGSM